MIHALSSYLAKFLISHACLNGFKALLTGSSQVRVVPPDGLPPASRLIADNSSTKRP